MQCGFFKSSIIGPLAVSLACSLPGAGVQAQPAGLPSMGAASAAELSPELERTLGEAIMEQGRRDPTYISDPEVNQYLTQMGHKLAASAVSASGQKVTVFAVRDPRINAFALPGGYVGINSGLLVSADSESELAGVVAHEIGHVMQRHVARGMTQQERSGHLMIASLVGALLAGLAGGGGDLAMGVAAFGQAAAIDQQLGFSRQAEQEADRVGLDMMRRAGFDPRGMVKTFSRLMNASRLNQGSGGGVYASTHPLSIQRMSDMENRIRSLPAAQAKDSATFWYVRAKLRVMQSRSGDVQPANVMAELQRETTLGSVRASAAWYGMAYAALQRNEIDKVEGYLKQAGWPDGGVAPLHNMAVALRLKQKRVDDALVLSQQAIRRWPNDLGAALGRVEALQKAGKHNEAIAFVETAVKRWPDDGRLYQMQADSYNRLKKGVEARRAMAAHYQNIGALPAAVEQLKQARNMTSDFYVKSQLDVEIRRLQDTVLENRALLERFE